MNDDWLKDPEEQAKVAELEKKEKRKRRTDQDEMRQIISTKQGRRFIWQLMSECGIFQTSFDKSGSITFFKEGERNVGLKILTRLNDADANAYGTMIKESKGGDYDV